MDRRTCGLFAFAACFCGEERAVRATLLALP
jgi:hypothetical protein